MCDIMFITPNFSGQLGESSLGTLQLATILRNNNISCEIFPYFAIGDVMSFDSFLQDTLKLVAQQAPKIVSFYTRCDVYHIVIRMAQYIKKNHPDCYIVFGGPQSDITARETMEQISWVDYVCRGEGENTVYPFFASLLKGEPNHSVPGLAYRDGDQVQLNPKPEMIADLDALPVMDYSLLKLKGELKEKKAFRIDVGRGCPFACTFCSTKSFWGRKYRVKSPERIVYEMQDIYDKYGATRFAFAHDMFTLNRQKVAETCRLMKNLTFDVQWGCSARLDCIDPELIDIMADSGMYSIYMGIETGSPRMQQLINKKLNLDRAVELAAYMKKKDIKCIASFIFGFPEETEEDLSQTMALMAKLVNLRSVDVQTHLCAFLAGTELTERYKGQLTPAEVYSDQTSTIAIDECMDLIRGYPELFWQMMEYKTELRDKLAYFPLFWNVWKVLQPAYQYMSEFYPEERLIDMYYDFVEINQQALEKFKDLPEDELLIAMLQEDRLYTKFEQDPNYDILSDLCRMERMKRCDAVQNGEVRSDLFCIAPDTPKKYDSLRDYPRCIAMINFSKEKCEAQIYALDQM